MNAGYKFRINKVFDLEPSFMLRYVYPVVPQLDLGIRGIYEEQFYLGLLYRTEDALSILVGYQTNDEKFTFGYAYDITKSNLDLFSKGSHEFMIKAKFGNIKSKRKRRKKKISKLERLERKLKELQTEGEDSDENEPEEGGMDNYDDTKEDLTEEKSTDEKPLQQQLIEVEQQNIELRSKVRSLRDEAEAQGFSSPNDPEFPKRQEYLDALDQIKGVYKKKKELDSLLD